MHCTTHGGLYAPLGRGGQDFGSGCDKGARLAAGFQLYEIQKGNDPADWKPMKAIAPGVREIRIRDSTGAFRIIYLANLPDRILVLHAFQKKTQQTPQKDIDLAASRLRAWRG